MKTRAAVSLALLLLVTACAGIKARTHALWPIVSSTWPAVREDCVLGLRGVSPSPSVASTMNQIEGAVRADDFELLRGLNWFMLEPLATEGVAVRVESGEISEGVAGSFRERNRQFSEAMRELTR